jgi:hypothetical protein
LAIFTKGSDRKRATRAAFVVLIAGLLLAVGLTPAGAVPRSDSRSAAIAVMSTSDVGVAAYGPFRTLYPPGTAWGPVSKSNVAVFGSLNYRQSYSWSTAPGTQQRACAEGWTPIFGGGWYSLGCGRSGSGSLLWGTYTAVPKMRFKSANLLGGTIEWFH